MIVNPNKSLIPVSVRTNGVGVVLDAFIVNDRNIQAGGSGPSKYEYSLVDIALNGRWPRSNGILNPDIPKPDDGQDDRVDWESKIAQAKREVALELAKYDLWAEAYVKAHTDKRGTVHGETKETVGMGKKDNFPMGTIQQQVDGELDNVFVNPLGLREIIDQRLKIDNRTYIPSRTFPVSASGIMGDVPMWSYDCEVGELVQAPVNPIEHLGETPFEFSTPTGITIFPSINNSPVQGRYTQVATDLFPMVYTPWGGTRVRNYNGRVDTRRTRPSFIRAWGISGYQGDLVKKPDALFDNNALYYMEGARVKIRSFNKIDLPFDTVEGVYGATALLDGIVQYSAEFLYNLKSSSQNRPYTGETNNIPHLLFQYEATKLAGVDLEIVSGPPLHAPEQVINAATTYRGDVTMVPAHGKIKVVELVPQVTSIVIPFKELFNFGSVDPVLWYNNLNHKLAKKISFGWRNRMRMIGSVRIPVGWYNKDKTKYWNGYVDFEIEFTPNDLTRTYRTDIVTNGPWELPKQTLDDNWDMVGEGLFKSHKPTTAYDPLHPLAMSGIFEPQGGHYKTYTLYNRQYIGFYKHELTKALEFNDLGIKSPEPIESFNYIAQGTINTDGMCGDHLRHIPIKVSDSGRLVTYLTQIRDARNRYRWAFVNTDNDHEIIQNRIQGNYIGPTVLDMSWANSSITSVPSFLIENDDLSSEMNIGNMVFNTANGFSNYLSVSIVENRETGMVTGKKVSIDKEVTDWVTEFGGNWYKTNTLFFYFKENLYWVNQCLGVNEYPDNGKDCFYGVIKNCGMTFDTDGNAVIKNRDPILNSVSINSTNVLTKSSLEVRQSEVVGFDLFETQDVYLMKSSEVGNVEKWDVMFAMAPFNNFYVNFELQRNNQNNVTSFGPSTGMTDPVFPWDPTKGFQIDYDKTILFGKEIPHRLHINYQSPVMLSRGMWRLCKTPNDFCFHTRRHGQVKIMGGVMGTFRGVCTHPVGSVTTINGRNTVVQKPVGIKLSDYSVYDEIFVKQAGASIVLSSFNKHGKVAADRSSPVGWLNGGEFSYYDPFGWKNAGFPTIDGIRQNFFGNGDSFPTFFGKPGSGTPVNRFFLTNGATVMTWDTSQGRSVPLISTRNVEVTVNGTTYQMNGAQYWTIPGTYTGVITLTIKYLETIKWGTGLAVLKSIGTEVMTLDFSNSANFTIEATLPKRIYSLKGLLKGGSGTYPGIANWDTSNVMDMSEMIMNTTNFNTALPWNFGNVRDMTRFAKGSRMYNQPITEAMNLTSVADMTEMFMDAWVFNSTISGKFPRCKTIARMFASSRVYNKGLGAAHFPVVQDIDGLFQDSLAFNTSINDMDIPSVEKATNVFKGAKVFNQPVDVSWKQCKDVSGFFANTVLFNNTIAMDLPVGRRWVGFLEGAKVFNTALPSWNFPYGTNISSMLAYTEKFNQPLTFDVSKVTKAGSFLRGSKAFQQPIAGFKFKLVEDLSYFFADCSYNAELPDWEFPTDPEIDVSPIGMFSNNPAFNRPIGYWNTTRFIYCIGVFEGAFAFNQEIGTWDFSNTKSLSKFLKNAKAFAKSLENINVSKVEDFSDFANGALEFQSDVNLWDVRNGLNFTATFANTNKFNSNQLDWRPIKALVMDRMYNNAILYNQDLRIWPVETVTSHVDFDLGATAWTQPRPRFNP